MPTTEAGKRLLERWDDDGIYFSHQLAAAIDAIEAEAREDCEREMLRQRDCDHSECIEKIEELSDQIARQAAADRTLGEAFDGVRAVAAERARISEIITEYDYDQCGWEDEHRKGLLAYIEAEEG